MKKVDIKLISANSTYNIRKKVLWEHKNLEDCFLKEDNFKETFHLGVLLEKKIVSIGTFIKHENLKFKNISKQYRLRAMGTLKIHQGKAFGKKLIDYSIKLLKKKKTKLLWCDARINAVPFYEKMGFKTIGDPYEIPIIGLHKLMYIYL